MSVLKTKRLKAINPADVSGSKKQVRVIVQVLPCYLIDVIAKEQCPKVSGTINNALGYESIDDAIVDAKTVSFSLLSNVKPENLFFFFSQCVQGLRNGFFEFCLANSIPYNSRDLFAISYQEQDYTNQESWADPLAIVFCKLKHAKDFERLIAEKQKNATKASNCYQVSWNQLKNFNNLINV